MSYPRSVQIIWDLQRVMIVQSGTVKAGLLEQFPSIYFSFSSLSLITLNAFSSKVEMNVTLPSPLWILSMHAKDDFLNLSAFFSFSSFCSLCISFLSLSVFPHLTSPPCIFLAAGAYIIRICTVYCELSPLLWALARSAHIGWPARFGPNP